MKQSGFEIMTVPEERMEVFNIVHQQPKMRAELPQSDFNGGILRQWTLLTDFYDAKGFNRKNSTFSLMGLKELGIIKNDYDPRSKMTGGR